MVAKNQVGHHGSFNRMLFIGHGGVGSNALSLYKGFSKELNQVSFIDTQFVDSPGKYTIRRILLRYLPYFYGFVASRFLGFRISMNLRKHEPEMIFVFKGNFVNAKTLAQICVPKIHYHPDDSSNPDNRTVVFNAAERSYDLHFTSKTHNLQEIALRTGKPVHFIWYAYDPDWHFRSADYDFVNRKYRLGFIGNFRQSRASLITKMANLYGEQFAIAGVRWQRIDQFKYSANLLGPIYGPLFSNFISCAPVQLGLLNSENRDTHTARTFEIPACGGLLIAEDTLEHRLLFEKDNGALFFRNELEIVNLISWIESHPFKAEIIARNGHKVITGGKNTWQDRARSILDVCQELFDY
jgi:hypothetical protein